MMRTPDDQSEQGDISVADTYLTAIGVLAIAIIVGSADISAGS